MASLPPQHRSDARTPPPGAMRVHRLAGDGAHDRHLRHRSWSSVLLGMLGWWTSTRRAELTVRQLTLFFTTFVFLQFWNMFNAKGFETHHSVFTCLKGCREFFLILAAIGIGQVLDRGVRRRGVPHRAAHGPRVGLRHRFHLAAGRRRRGGPRHSPKKTVKIVMFKRFAVVCLFSFAGLGAMGAVRRTVSI